MPATFSIFFFVFLACLVREYAHFCIFSHFLVPFGFFGPFQANFCGFLSLLMLFFTNFNSCAKIGSPSVASLGRPAWHQSVWWYIGFLFWVALKEEVPAKRLLKIFGRQKKKKTGRKKFGATIKKFGREKKIEAPRALKNQGVTANVNEVCANVNEVCANVNGVCANVNGVCANVNGYVRM